MRDFTRWLARRAGLALGVVILGLAMAPFALAASGPGTRPTLAGKGEVLNFSLLDYRGRVHDLRRTDAKYVVLFFTGADCPIGRQLAPGSRR